jgi:opacity protein-like surface antigen
MNTKKAICALALAAAAILPGAAYSQMITSSYFGATLGGSDSRDFCENRTGQCDKTGTAWRLYSGLGFTRNLGLEIAIVDLGQFSHAAPGTDTKLETLLSEAVAVFTYPVQRIAIFGKVGGFYGGTKATIQTAAGQTNARETSAGLTYGAGAKFDISSRFALRGDWQHYAKVGGTDTGGEVDVNVFMVGLEWKFR